MKDAKSNQNAKRVAAEKALSYVEDRMVLGVGTGSTMRIFIELLGQKCKEGFHVRAVPTSFESKLLCYQYGIELLEIDLCNRVDLAVDGADQLDRSLRAIKGGGAAHTTEKIVAAMANRFLICVDESKVVDDLSRYKVPLEVLPIATSFVERRVQELGANLQLRKGSGKDGPVVSDHGNLICDLEIENGNKRSLSEWNRELLMIPGVVETGLFLGLCEEAVVGYDDGTTLVIHKQ